MGEDPAPVITATYDIEEEDNVVQSAPHFSVCGMDVEVHAIEEDSVHFVANAYSTDEEMSGDGTVGEEVVVEEMKTEYSEVHYMVDGLGQVWVVYDEVELSCTVTGRVSQ